jgi:hypothetical protein
MACSFPHKWRWPREAVGRVAVPECAYNKRTAQVQTDGRTRTEPLEDGRALMAVSGSRSDRFSIRCGCEVGARGRKADASTLVQNVPTKMRCRPRF